MKIEILTLNTSKKPEILTFLKELKDFSSAGGQFSAAGVIAEFSGKYMLFTTALPWLADEVIRRLFTIKPAPFSTGFYEIEGDQKVIVTCPARPVPQLVSGFDVLEHLDVEAGEIYGNLSRKWASRDVWLSAHFQVAVQGGVAVAKVKFAPHFRDSEFHCRKVISMVSLAGSLGLITTEERGLRQPASTSPAVLTASALVDGKTLAEFINRSPCEVSFSGDAGSYRIDLSGKGNRLLITRQKGDLSVIDVIMEEPWNTDSDTVHLLTALFGVKEAELKRTITEIVLEPRVLLQRLGFFKDRDFHVFRADLEGMEARYDVSRREMVVRGLLPGPCIIHSQELFIRMEEFTERVISFAV